MKKTAMKKIAMILISLVTLAALMTTAYAAAQTPWYELSANNTVLTVRLTGDNWNWEISNPDALELITMESDGNLIASFMSTADTANNVSLILRQAEDPAQAADATRVLELGIDEANVITINSILTIDPAADWFEIDENGDVLTVRLPGPDWTFEVVDPQLAELITLESNEGFIASFMATMTEAGTTQLVFTADDGSQIRTIDLFVNESGMLFAQRAETFDILKPAAPANSFTFIPVETFTPAEMEPVEFKTVTVTGGTVNLRVAATTEVDSIAKLHKGDIARYLGETATDKGGMQWYNIAFGDMDGWIAAKYVKMGGEGYVRIVNGNVNMRTAPNMDGSIIKVLKKDSIVKYLGQGMTDSRGADWYKVSEGGKEGWVSAKYAVFSAPPAPVKKETKNTGYAYVVIQNGKAYLRKEASKDSARVTTLQNGTVATYLGQQATDYRGVVWYNVTFNGKTGWVSSKYAKLTNDSGIKQPANQNQPANQPANTDMRLVYNPNRYDLLQVHDMYSQDGQTIYVVGNFGTVNASGEPSYFDSRKNVTLKLVAGAEVMVPADPFNDSEIRETADAYLWFNSIRQQAGGSYTFYASFSMNEAGELRNLVYRPMY